MTHKRSLLFTAVFATLGVVTLSDGALARGLEGGRTGMSEEQSQQVEAQKTALTDRLTAAKEARANKLEAKRLAICEKREARINAIITKGAEQSRKQLAVFQKIEEKVKQFYIDKNLSTEGYDLAVVNADDKEAAAVAAIEASLETKFDCDTTDGAKPGEAIKELVKTRHDALKAYRTAIKDLILVVKKGHGQQQNATESTETSGEGQ